MGGMGAGPFLLHFAGQFIRRLGNGVKVEDVGRRGASQKRDGYECNEIHFLMFVCGRFVQLCRCARITRTDHRFV